MDWQPHCQPIFFVSNDSSQTFATDSTITLT
jgi:hypothetical protein